jgi:hypothetical protein
VRFSALLPQCAVEVLTLFVALGLLAAVSAAQEKPDFSGRWVLVSSRKSDDSVARDMLVRHTPDHPDAPGGVLHVERGFGKSGGIESETLLIGVYSGTVNGISRGSTQAYPLTSSRVSITWSGSRLVIEKSSYSGPGTAAQHVEEWSLTGKNILLITMTDRIGGSMQPKTRTVVYRRQ